MRKTTVTPRCLACAPRWILGLRQSGGLQSESMCSVLGSAELQLPVVHLGITPSRKLDLKLKRGSLGLR